MEKERLDVILVNKGIAESREKAKALIMTGNVFVNNQREDKAGQKIPLDAYIEIKGKKMKYVSRGGYKLEKAIESFDIDLTDKYCMDVGASTGGFTDCMLQNGASHVYSVDVGTNQLAWKLRNDERVTSMEKTNARYMEPAMFDKKIEFVSVDVAFISLKKILLPIKGIMEPGAKAVCLIKPQFEVGREKVGKKGVVREPELHKEVIRDIIEYSLSGTFSVLNLDYSPIKGPEGNIEYLIYLENSNQELDEEQVAAEAMRWDEKVEEVVSEAHQSAVKHVEEV
ncbi:TlyA family RNA methyltransferase [Eubacterium xylanophilum]|uniref:TlyA family RNA methyltransferase n=1 Tax=Eubacterium xylanophilum TaxID=39497 RepID=UPI00047C4514|nr:TlyA family RNA methyltransferase [Eubacterium xylanophilum]